MFITYKCHRICVHHSCIFSRHNGLMFLLMPLYCTAHIVVHLSDRNNRQRHRTRISWECSDFYRMKTHRTLASVFSIPSFPCRQRTPRDRVNLRKAYNASILEALSQRHRRKSHNVSSSQDTSFGMVEQACHSNCI